MTDPSVVLSAAIADGSIEDDSGAQPVIRLDLDATDITTAHLEDAPLTRTSYAIPRELAVQIAEGILEAARD